MEDDIKEMNLSEMLFNRDERLLDYITNLQKTQETLIKNDNEIITNLQEENERLNNIIKKLDKMFEYYFLGNLKYDQDTVNTIYIKYVRLKELKEDK